MTTLSTLDRIRESIEQARRRSSGDVDERLREALRLLDSLAPATPPADPVDALRVALDYGMEREWPLDVREAFARALPELQITTRWWVDEGDDVGNRYDAITGRVVGRIRRGTEGRWRATLPEERPAAASLEGAQADVDEQLSGWVLGGGAVGRPVSGTNASFVLPLESEWGTPPARSERYAFASTCPTCLGSTIDENINPCGTCAGEGVVRVLTPPEEEQPDASWLRHVRPADGNVRLGWVYEGGTLLQLAQFPSGAIPLLTWLNARGQLIGDPEYFQGEGLPRVRLVTRAPLDGDWCASCGANIDGERFLTSRIRIVAGEEARVCGDCAEDSDGGWP